jgi:hypothetical protein
MNKNVQILKLTGEPGQYAAFKNILPSGNPSSNSLSVVRYKFKVTPGAEVEARIYGEFTTEKTNTGEPALYMVLGVHIENFPGAFIGACFGSTRPGCQGMGGNPTPLNIRHDLGLVPDAGEPAGNGWFFTPSSPQSPHLPPQPKSGYLPARGRADLDGCCIVSVYPILARNDTQHLVPDFRVSALGSAKLELCEV